MRCLVLVMVAACGVPLAVVQPVASPEHEAATTADWQRQIRTVARDGDWILAARTEDLSHAAIYDAGHDTVIEAAGAEIREVPLQRLLDVARYVVVVRPIRMSAQDEIAALARARARIGLAVEVGMPAPEDERGSELVYWASQTEARVGAHESIVTPGILVKYGEVIYYSGKRGELVGPPGEM
jgi:hypothetical protein